MEQLLLKFYRLCSNVLSRKRYFAIDIFIVSWPSSSIASHRLRLGCKKWHLNKQQSYRQRPISTFCACVRENISPYQKVSVVCNHHSKRKVFSLTNIRTMNKTVFVSIFNHSRSPQTAFSYILLIDNMSDKQLQMTLPLSALGLVVVALIF